MYKRDWRNALHNQPVYRMGTRTVQFNCHYALLLAALCVFLVFIYMHVNTDKPSINSISEATWRSGATTTKVIRVTNAYLYNATYPITAPHVAKDGSITYRIGMVADLDTKSKFVKDDGSTVWRSYLKQGHLTYLPQRQEIKVRWDAVAPTVLESGFALKGRGMELSELVTFDGKLLSFDDRTGIVYELVNEKPIPWVILLDGNGRNTTKGFKAEWATVKDETLHVGSMGKEWTSSAGTYQSDDPMFIKSIAPNGAVTSSNWAFPYKKMRTESQQISWPGYQIHESGMWSNVQRKWFFLPRRCSKERYNETQDEYMGCKVLIIADEQFENIRTVNLDKDNSPNTHGFSSFKFVPHSEDRVIVAIKSEELHEKTSTFITAFDIEGNIILPEQRIDTDFKYEGIEFI